MGEIREVEHLRAVHDLHLLAPVRRRDAEANGIRKRMERWEGRR